MYICTYVYTHKQIHTNTHTYKHTHTHTYIYIYIRICNTVSETSRSWYTAGSPRTGIGAGLICDPVDLQGTDGTKSRPGYEGF